jgi:hypothetical protein
MEVEKKDLIPVNMSKVPTCSVPNCLSVGWWRATMVLKGGQMETDLFACTYHMKNDPDLPRRYLDRDDVQKELQRQMEPFGLVLRDMMFPDGVDKITVRWEECVVKVEHAS